MIQRESVFYDAWSDQLMTIKPLELLLMYELGEDLLEDLFWIGYL